MREKIQVYNLVTASYETVSDQPAPTSDATTVIPLKNDPAVYIDGSGTAKVLITYYGGSTLSWTAYLNQVQWNVIY